MTMSSDVEKLADHLLDTGLAMSKEQAAELASDIDSSSKREKNPGKESGGKDHLQDAVREMRERAINSEPVEVRVDYETPFGDAPLEEVTAGKVVPESSDESEEGRKKPVSSGAIDESGVDLGSVFDFSG